MIAETSVTNYREHRSSGRLGAQALEIVQFLANRTDRDFSRAEIAEILGLRLSSICGRVNELIKSDHVEQSAQTRRCQVTGKTVRPVRLRGLL